MKRIVLAFGVLVFVAAAAAGTTGAFFTDTKTTGDNRFKAGTLSIGVDQSMYGSLPVVVTNWAPGEPATVEFNVINTGTLPVHLRTYSSGAWDFPAGNPGYFKVTSVDRMNERSEWVSLAISPVGITDKVYYSNDGSESSLIPVLPGATVKFRQKVLFDPAAGNDYQGRTFSAKIVVDAKQTTPGATWPASGPSVSVSCPSDGSVKIVEQNGTFVISWAGNISGTLQSTTDIANGPWVAVTQSAQFVDGCSMVTETVTSPRKFYRLLQTGTGSSNTSPLFTISSPSAGVQLEKGKTYTISWTSSNIPATDRIAIHLKDLASGTFINQFASIPNSGSVSWTIPSDIPGGTYAIVINNCISGNVSACTTQSGPTFVIKDAGAGSPTISVTGPGAGVTLSTGSTYSITWTANNIGTNDRIAIQAKNVLKGTFVNLFASIPNTGSVSWTVPSTFETGDYRIVVDNCVTGNTSTCVAAEGPSVHVSTLTANVPTLAIASPTDGVFEQGRAYTIQWLSHHIPSTDKVSVQIKSESTQTFTVILAEGAASGSTSWTVPTTLPAGTYKILVNTCITGNTTPCMTGTGSTVTIAAAPVVSGQAAIEITSPGNISIQRQGSVWVAWKTTNIPPSDKLALQFKNVTTGTFITIFPSMSNSGGIGVPLSSLEAGTYQTLINNCVTGNASACIAVSGQTFTVTE